MNYSKTTWIEGQTTLSPNNLNKLETQHEKVVGTTQQEFTEILAMFLNVDTRSLEITRDGSGKVQYVYLKDGVTILQTLELIRTDGKLSSMVLTANGKTITATINRTDDKISGITKVVS